MYKNQQIGKFGEDEAVKYLIKKGYKILDRNFECSQGEIDIIALDKKEVVFIEVKTRTNISFGEPAEAVNYYKAKHLLSSIEYYIYKRNLMEEFIRIDIIEVYVKNNSIRINQIKNAIQ